eukprot:scaffold27330_cov36-Phaeocystis_antarctica.AAC.1
MEEGESGEEVYFLCSMVRARAGLPSSRGLLTIPSYPIHNTLARSTFCRAAPSPSSRASIRWRRSRAATASARSRCSHQPVVLLLTPYYSETHYSLVLTALTRRDRAARAGHAAHGLDRGPDLLRGARTTSPYHAIPPYHATPLTFCEAHEPCLTATHEGYNPACPSCNPTYPGCNPLYLRRTSSSAKTSSPRSGHSPHLATPPHHATPSPYYCPLTMRHPLARHAPSSYFLDLSVYQSIADPSPRCTRASRGSRRSVSPG